MPNRRAPGRSFVTRRSVVDIVRAAVLGSYGVTGISGRSIGRRLLRWSGLRQSGIRVSFHGGVAVELDLTVGVGLPIAEVARQVDSAVRYSVRRALGLEVTTLVIHVDGLRYDANHLPSAPVSSAPTSSAPERWTPGPAGNDTLTGRR
ncbi:MAG TPA: Asp23/Gls24 family envelope stress response protein [Candidatus Saccharimonadales bacterium]|nr:Asp23/Gls24 family envelope stress response protein [Candidatus Saccharimonadales bacterium]